MTRARTAIVTGSTSGIGLAVARALAADGCNLVFNGFGEPAAIDALVAGAAAAHGVETVYHPADMTRPAEVRDLVAFAERRFGGVDILVNNAGVQHVAPLDAFPDAEWDRLLAVNLSAAFHATKAALPGMRRRNFGRIVNIASVHGLVGSVHKAAYVAAKHGLVGLTKVAALETADADITVNAVCPGWVDTPLVRRQIEDRAREAGVTFEEATDRLIGEKQPKRRFVRAEDVAALVVFLCGESGAAMTAEVLTLDGGWTAR
jgi:3-hydroxybutyrate dehydrogenase